MFLVRANRHRNVACVFNRGPRVTHYLSCEDGSLNVHKEDNDRFDIIFSHTPLKGGEEYTALQFALAYTRTESARKMIPITPSAYRVLTAILKGQMPDDGDDDSATQLEKIMAAAKEETGFRKPEGNVAQVHKFLDQKLEQIKKGTVSRKELVDKLEEKGIPRATATTQAGVWARTNGIQFPRPKEADENKSAARKKAAKKSKATAVEAAAA